MSVATLGEILLRLSPPANELPFQSPELRTYVAGAEANVATQLARLGHKVRMLSAVPGNELGRGVCRKLREHGVDTGSIIEAEGRLGLYLVTTGAGVRSSHVVYDRDATSFQRLSPDSWDWPVLFDNIRFLHVSGITAALAETTERVLDSALDAARDLGIKISFDCNYRHNLWQARGCDPVPVLTRLIGKADLLFGNHRDISLLSAREFSGEGPERRRIAAEHAFALFPNLTGIASTARHAIEADRHILSARIDRQNQEIQTENVEIARIVDRIGSGDAYCAGVLDVVLSGGDDQLAAQTGLALAVLKHTLPGDAALFSREDVQAYLAGHFDVRR